jgi:hypothetical protein
MARGTIYIATSEIDGLIKIGRTQNIMKRKHELETAGYMRQKCDVVFAIELNDYEAKESLLHTLFNNSRAGKSEFFAADIELVKQTMLAFSGTVVYPKNVKQEQMFKEVTEIITVKQGIIPEGEYTLTATVKGFDEKCTGTLLVTKDNKLILKKGAIFGPIKFKGQASWIDVRNNATMVGNVLGEDIECTSPSMAASIVCGNAKNGWVMWKNSNDEYIDIYRKGKEED